MTKKIVSILIVLFAFGAVMAQDGRVFNKTILETDIAVNGFTAAIQERTFYVEGYLYPAGTLNDSNGINPDGTPEFPDLLIGRWTCSGWFVGDRTDENFIVGALTNQIFEFDSETPGNDTIVTYGIENGEFATVFTRAVIGGTGQYADAEGEQKQAIIGVNAAGTVNMAVSFDKVFKIQFKK